MLLLAIDTSTTAITVALHDGSGVVAEETTLDARAHAEHLAPGIEKVLHDASARPADVTDVVVGIGPGPFTGLRVGIVTGHTFAFALGLPVRGLCSLDALAHAAWLGGQRGELLVATDARRKEVYAAHYLLDAAAAVRVAGPVVDKAVSLPDDWRAMPTVGRGPLLYPEALPNPAHDATPATTTPAATTPGPVEVLPGQMRRGIISNEAGAEPFEVILDSPGSRHTSNQAGGLLDVSAGALADLAVRRHAAGAEFDGLEPLYLRRPDVSPAAPTKSTLG